MVFTRFISSSGTILIPHLFSEKSLIEHFPGRRVQLTPAVP